MRAFCFFTATVVSLYANSFHFKDIKIVNEKLFAYHLLYESFNETVIERSVSNIVAHLDPTRFYFYEGDIQKFSTLHGNIKMEYEENRFDSYLYIRQVFENRVKGLRKLRAKVYRDILKGKINVARLKTYSTATSPLTSKNQEDRIRFYLSSYLNEYAAGNHKKALTQEEKRQCLNFLERKLKSHEERFLPVSNYPLFLSKMIASSLDAHSMVFDKEEIGKINAKLVSQMTGIGISVADGINGPIIRRCIKGGPADRSLKIFKGDRICYINGIDVSMLSYEKVMRLLSLTEGQTILLQLRSKNGTKKIVKLMAEKIQIQKDRITVTKESFLDGTIACLKVDSFYNDFDGNSISVDLKRIIKSIAEDTKLYGVVIDMRENLGGFFIESVKTVDLFSDKGTVVVAKFKNDEVRFSKEYDPHKVYGGPLIILTSQYSASAAEVLAQALQDVGVAIIAGDDSTFGKGSIQYQTITDPRSHYKYKVTIGKYYTVSGRTTQLKGVRADIIVPSKYSGRKIGEKHLSYALPADQLTGFKEIDMEVRHMFDYQNKRKRTAVEIMKPRLAANSAKRIQNSKNYQAFLASLGPSANKGSMNKEDKKKNAFGKNDLQMTEAMMIIKDMHMMLESYQGSYKK